MKEQEPLELTLDLESIPVTLSKGGQKKQYTIRQLTGEGRDEYLDMTGKRLSYDNAGKPQRIKTFKGSQAELLQFCLFDESTGKAMTAEEIQQFPAKTQTALFEEAQELNGLGAQEEESAKKD